jgi:hypothetical protein
MRLPGAPATAPPALSTSLTVADGRAYTVARMGAPGEAEARIIEDDRTLPAAGKAKLRVVQAAQRTLDVSWVDGPVVATGVAFTTTTDYQGVKPGKRELRVQPSGGQPTTVPAALTAGSIYSLLVLQTADGQVTAAVLADARREGPVPRGGVETGAGGTVRDGGAVRDGSTAAPVLAVVLLAGLLVVAFGGAVAAYRPRPVRVRRR